MNVSGDKPQVMPITARKNGIILADNVCIGYQVSSLLDRLDWKMRVVHSEQDLYLALQQKALGVLIADIMNDGLGGLSALEHCRNHHPSITTYAITQYNDRYRKKMARDEAGCQGFFYLVNGNLQVDTSHGMAAVLTQQQHPDLSRIIKARSLSDLGSCSEK
ncbi:MAG: DNA-binding response regulator [Zetaproteobacteria bacterium CG_4_9_14_3_um_filter_49_83]|nr:MAG: hypothetical protein AUJ56_05435 [Zetaproteobacteria bacterium CG1_02_49_23]PIQ31981.1 MAG: hypothetical protein COW62_08455 [Zetaproteobacteria bacterium CG17_big_fil_post_rev_8_21_14_2_50_50_13]PIY56302.1 MAG: DNA-binding response regulator [Zetaproteobacteria bacterium CG_4_10_14_0_8_um_filter_49_80]PJA35386.1 MAG: DNA-binding response regulator [Zetaproteobacteria bacterium CG_4_9_14_3_um_filter_49_83]